MDDGTLLPHPVDPDVSVEASAIDEVVEILPLSIFASAAGEITDAGWIARIRLTTSRGLNVRSPTRSEFSTVLLLLTSGRRDGADIDGLNPSKILWSRASLSWEISEDFLLRLCQNKVEVGFVVEFTKGKLDQKPVSAVCRLILSR